METLQTILRFLLIWLRIIPEPDFLARFVSDRPAPDAIAKGWIYIVGGKGYQKWASFRCPADNEEIIQLSLMPSRAESTVSLRPLFLNVTMPRRPQAAVLVA